MEKVILVDNNDREIGTEEKLKAHREGKLHRAVSVLIFSPKGELLIQKRAKGKYHSPGIWANTCCSHPRPGEEARDAAMRRLKEEMGIASNLGYLFSFIYKAELGKGMTENEYDHVFSGVFDGNPAPDNKEVEEWKWIPLDALVLDMKAYPEKYAHWFRIIIKNLPKEIKYL